MEIFHNKTKYLHGSAAIEKIAYELQRYHCSRPLLVSDMTSYQEGYVNKFKKILAGSDLDIRSVTLTRAAGSVELAEQIAKKTEEEECNCIIALGADYVIDTCKLARALAKSGATKLEELVDLEGGKDNFPLIVVPTDYGAINAATGRISLIGRDGIELKINNAACTPECVVTDVRMCRRVQSKQAVMAARYAAHVASCAVVFDSSALAFAFARAATGLIGEVMEKYVRKRHVETEGMLDIMSATVYAGVAYNGIQENILEIFTDSVAALSGINHKDIFNGVVPSFLRINSDNGRMGDLLIDLIGLEKALAYPVAERGAGMVKTDISVCELFGKRYKYKWKLNEKLALVNFDTVYRECLRRGTPDSAENRLLIRNLVNEIFGE